PQVVIVMKLPAHLQHSRDVVIRPRRLNAATYSFSIVLAAAISACSSGSKGPTPADLGSGSTSMRVPIGQLPRVDIDSMVQHTKMLASDEYEGRAPGTKGEALTVAYLTEQFEKAGLQPGNTDGSYVQNVPLVGITPEPAPLAIRNGGQQLTLKWKDD